MKRDTLKALHRASREMTKDLDLRTRTNAKPRNGFKKNGKTDRNSWLKDF